MGGGRFASTVALARRKSRDILGDMTYTVNITLATTATAAVREELHAALRAGERNVIDAVDEWSTAPWAALLPCDRYGLPLDPAELRVISDLARVRGSRLA